MLVVGDVIRLPGPAPSAAEVHPADIAEVSESEYEILELPSGNVSRARARNTLSSIKSVGLLSSPAMVNRYTNAAPTRL